VQYCCVIYTCYSCIHHACAVLLLCNIHMLFLHIHQLSCLLICYMIIQIKTHIIQPDNILVPSQSFMRIYSKEKVNKIIFKIKAAVYSHLYDVWYNIWILLHIDFFPSQHTLWEFQTDWVPYKCMHVTCFTCIWLRCQTLCCKRWHLRDSNYSQRFFLRSIRFASWSKTFTVIPLREIKTKIRNFEQKNGRKGSQRSNLKWPNIHMI